jgi:hypothetical protein
MSPSLPPRYPVPMTPGRPGTMAVALFSPRGTAAFGVTGNTGTYNLTRRRPSGMPEIGKRFDDEGGSGGGDTEPEMVLDSDGKPMTGLAYHTYMAARESAAAASGAPLQPTTPKGPLTTIAEVESSESAALRRTFGTESGGETGDSSSLKPVIAEVVQQGRRSSVDSFMPTPPTLHLAVDGSGPLGRRARRTSALTHEASAPASAGATQGTAPAAAVTDARRSSVSSTSASASSAAPPAMNPFARRTSNSFLLQGEAGVPPSGRRSSAVAVSEEGRPVVAVDARRSSVSTAGAATPKMVSPTAADSRRGSMSGVPGISSPKPGTGINNPFARRSSQSFTLQPTVDTTAPTAQTEGAASAAPGSGPPPVSTASAGGDATPASAGGRSSRAGSGLENPFARRSSRAFSLQPDQAAVAESAAAAAAALAKVEVAVSAPPPVSPHSPTSSRAELLSISIPSLSGDASVVTAAATAGGPPPPPATVVSPTQGTPTPPRTRSTSAVLPPPPAGASALSNPFSRSALPTEKFQTQAQAQVAAPPRHTATPLRRAPSLASGVSSPSYARDAPVGIRFSANSTPSSSSVPPAGAPALVNEGLGSPVQHQSPASTAGVVIPTAAEPRPILTVHADPPLSSPAPSHPQPVSSSEQNALVASALDQQQQHAPPLLAMLSSPHRNDGQHTIDLTIIGSSLASLEQSQEPGGGGNSARSANLSGRSSGRADIEQAAFSGALSIASSRSGVADDTVDGGATGTDAAAGSSQLPRASLPEVTSRPASLFARSCVARDASASPHSGPRSASPVLIPPSHAAAAAAASLRGVEMQLPALTSLPPLQYGSRRPSASWPGHSTLGAQQGDVSSVSASLSPATGAVSLGSPSSLHAPSGPHLDSPGSAPWRARKLKEAEGGALPVRRLSASGVLPVRPASGARRRSSEAASSALAALQAAAADPSAPAQSSSRMDREALLHGSGRISAASATGALSPDISRAAFPRVPGSDPAPPRSGRESASGAPTPQAPPGGGRASPAPSASGTLLPAVPAKAGLQGGTGSAGAERDKKCKVM